MNALLRARLAKPAVAQPNHTARDVSGTAKAIRHVQWLWHIAECRHAINGTECGPVADDLQQRIAAARMCGC